MGKERGSGTLRVRDVPLAAVVVEVLGAVHQLLLCLQECTDVVSRGLGAEPSAWAHTWARQLRVKMPRGQGLKEVPVAGTRQEGLGGSPAGG